MYIEEERREIYIYTWIYTYIYNKGSFKYDMIQTRYSYMY